VSTILVSLIAVAGTLLGSLTTYLFQRRTALHAEGTARAERLRQDRRVACGDFVAAVTDVKRAVVTAWFRRETKDDAWRTAMTDADIKGAAAEGAQLRMLLLTDDDHLRQLSDDLIAEPDVLRSATDRNDLRTREAAFAAKRAAFIAAARSHIA
jgi:hypothetical protein